MALLALTLISRVLIPAGYMVAPAAAGALPNIVICSGTGPMTMAATKVAPGHEDHGDTGRHDGGQADHPCAFASASAAVDLVAVSHPAAALAIPEDRVVIDPLAPRPGLGLAAPPPPQTGPPLTR